MWIITFFGLKSGQGFKNCAAHIHQEFQGEPPPPPPPPLKGYQFPLLFFTFQYHIKKPLEDLASGFVDNHSSFGRLSLRLVIPLHVDFKRVLFKKFLIHLNLDAQNEKSTPG